MKDGVGIEPMIKSICIIPLVAFNKSDKMIRVTRSFIILSIVALEYGTFVQAQDLNSPSDHKSPPANVSIQFYANHRMNPPNGSNSNTNHVDQATSDSIMRPQLAVQIYANPTQTGSESKTAAEPNFLRSNNQRQRGYLSPIETSSSKRTKLSSSDDGETQIIQTPVGDFSMTKLNPWHYVTDSGGATGSSSTMSGSNSPLPVQSTYEQNEPPMINAIITVPAPDRQQQDRASKRNQRIPFTSLTSSNMDYLQNTTSGLEHTIARLIEAQNAGNIEFSMNLNGDELVVNPHVKINTTREDTTSEAYGSDQKLMRGSRQVLGKLNSSLQKHISSELDGVQQSASEIDSIDGQTEDGYSNDSDTDYETTVPNKSTSELVVRSDNKDQEDDSETGSNSDKRNKESDADRDNKRPLERIFHDKSSSRGEDSLESSNYDSRSPPTSLSLSALNDEEENGDRAPQKQSKEASRTRQFKTKRLKTSRYPASQKPDMNQKKSQRRKSSSGRGASSADERDANDDDQGSNTTTQPSVVIRGEDLRKFEQLLESLRSLSLSNLEMARSRRVSRLSKETDQNQGSDEEHQGHSTKDDPGISGDKRWSESGYRIPYPSKETSSSYNRLSSSKVPPFVTRDCSERKSSLSKSASNEEPSTSSSYENDSSNGGDLDNLANNDSVEDLNEDGSQNIVTGSRADENYSLDSKPNAIDRSNDSAKLEDPVYDPSTVLTRKTILQSYYDSNAKHANSMRNPDEVEDIHKSQHEEQHEKHLNEIIRSSNEHGRGATQTSDEQADRQDSPVEHNLIDYSQLNDQELYRGQESQSHQVSASREQLERMRILQHILEKAASEVSKKRASKSSK